VGGSNGKIKRKSICKKGTQVGGHFRNRPKNATGEGGKAEDEGSKGKKESKASIENLAVKKKGPSKGEGGGEKKKIGKGVC